ncbi:YqiA/YcfP family alpha/beta fold hydrolase [Sulfurisoma sediminicola]|uniref:Esterase n=1 Tax=Sulfurisoma sediminicola TaxID=1381557 RepID=A0A497XKF6_9PROT|nr:YqiA/YcfP family alpha/beta fold hydrolase [Sulfurisoma sediminicola]RLJ68411.1 hypothetical protein DFR35_0971 [Sulfurisoma sediminicola]
MILYLHGFTSGPQSQKARLLGARAAERGIEFVCPQLRHSPAAAIDAAEAIISKILGAGGTVALVGSSLGGYYATYLAEKHGLRAVLVNPAVVAHISLEKFVGPQQNLYSGERFDFTREHIAELRALEVARLSRPENLWLLVEAGDEVLDYRQAVTRYAGARQTVLAGGDHSFTRWAEVLDQVIDFANEHPV